MPGTLVVRPIEANLTHKTDIIMKMKPYISIISGSQKFANAPATQGGQHPVWTDAITVPVGVEQSLVLQVLDKDLLTKDDIIGATTLNLHALQGQTVRNWYPLVYKDNKPAGEILLETSFQGGNFVGGHEQVLMGQNIGLSQQSGYIENRHTFSEQRQSVDMHAFTKNVEVVETVPVQKQIEVTESRKVMRDVEYTQAVPVTRNIETVEPTVVTKEVEVMEQRVVNKTIQVIENVAVKRQVEVVEMVHSVKNVETFEPQTFHKQVEVTEHVPVMRTVTVSEPVTITKSVEFVEPVITTQTITKEIMEPVVVSSRTTQEVGPASVHRTYATGNVTVGQQVVTNVQQHQHVGAPQVITNVQQQQFVGAPQVVGVHTTGVHTGVIGNRMCTKHNLAECTQAGCYDTVNKRWI